MINKEDHFEFISYWDETYGKMLPLDFQFKFDLSEYWFRIHNLPKSKRYPENEDEYIFLLNRQKKLLNHLIDEKDTIFYLIGRYNYEEKGRNRLNTEIGEFRKMKTIDLFETEQEVLFGPYDKGQLYETYIKKSSWNFKSIERVLRKIANDNFDYRFSIINRSQDRIFVPYDGGMDIIMENKDSKNLYREIYSEWLSSREDGM